MLKRILCFGDSNTWGANPRGPGRLDENTRWTALLQEKLGSSYRIIEEGQNGRTCEMDDPVEGEKSGIDYLYPCIESQLPLDLFIVMLGTNDMKVRFGRSAEEISAGLERVVMKAQKCLDEHDSSARILVLSPIELHENMRSADFSEMFGGEAGIAKSKQLAAYYQKIAERHGCYFLDMAKVAQASPVDALHLDAEGHAQIAAALEPKIRAILADKAD